MKSYKPLTEYLNLTESEAKAYLAATRIPNVSISDLSKTIGMSRTSVYSPLRKLIERGLVTETKIGKRVKYNAVNPKVLLNLFERNKVNIERLVKELSQSYVLSQSKVSAEFFPGMSGFESAVETFLNNTKTKMWKTIENASNVPTASMYQFEDFIKRRVQKRIFCRCILAVGPLTPWIKERLEKDKEELRQNVLVSAKTFPMQAIVAVTKGLVLFASFSDAPYAILIKSYEVSETLSLVHDMLWNQYMGDNKNEK
ncbi:hypothetical protein HYW58_00440 [Candidatus Kaiserbacteria bacterium]|nr:hypothetical protein [Candidatus Kaiserbacteria bacterium]